MRCLACAWVREVFARQQFRFERAEERLTHRVVIAVACGAHRRLHARFTAAPPEGDRRILASLVRVMDHAVGVPLRQRHVQRPQHQFRVQVVGHGPADDAPAEYVEHHGQIQESLAGRDVGGIRHLQYVRRVGAEVSLHQIGRAPRPRALTRGGLPGPAACPA